MASDQSRRRRGSPLLRELRIAARRGVVASPERLTAWRAAVDAALAASSPEAEELVHLYAALTAAGVRGHLDRLDLPAEQTARPFAERAATLRQLWDLLFDAQRWNPETVELETVFARLAGVQSRLDDERRRLMPLDEGAMAHAIGDTAAIWPLFAETALGSRWLATSTPAILTTAHGLGESLAERPPFPSSVRSSQRFARALRQRTNDCLDHLTGGAFAAVDYGGFGPMEMPLVTLTRLRLDWIDGEPDPWADPELIRRVRAATESLNRRGARIELVRGRAVPGALYDPTLARPATAFAVDARSGLLPLGGVDVLEQAQLVAQRPGLLQVIVAPRAARQAANAGAPGLPAAGGFTTSQLSDRAFGLPGARPRAGATAAGPAGEVDHPSLPLVLATQPESQATPALAEPSPLSARPTMVSRERPAPGELSRASPSDAGADSAREPLTTERLRLVLDWIDGEDPRHRPELARSLQTIAERLARRGIQLEIVRGQDVPAHRYDPGRAVAAAELSLASTAGPILLGAADALDRAIPIAQRPGLLQLLVAPRARGWSAIPSAPFASGAIDLPGGEQWTGESVPPDDRPLVRRPTVAPVGEPAPPAPVESPPVGAESAPPRPPRAPSRIAPPAALARSEAPVQIRLDWVAGGDPWQDPEWLERADQAVRRLAARGVTIELQRGREVPSEQYVAAAAGRASDFAVRGPAGPVLLEELDVLDQAILQAQRPGFFQVLVAPRSAAQPPWGAPRHQRGEVPPDRPVVWPSAGGDESGMAGDRFPATAITPSLSPTAGSRKPTPSISRIEVILDWVEGQPPWRGDQPWSLAETIHRLEARGIHLELVRGRAVPAALYEASQPGQPAALGVTTPNGPVVLSDLPPFEGAVPISQRPGQLRILLGPAPVLDAPATPPVPPVSASHLTAGRSITPPVATGIPGLSAGRPGDLAVASRGGGSATGERVGSRWFSWPRADRESLGRAGQGQGQATATDVEQRFGQIGTVGLDDAAPAASPVDWLPVRFRTSGEIRGLAPSARAGQPERGRGPEERPSSGGEGPRRRDRASPGEPMLPGLLAYLAPRQQLPATAAAADRLAPPTAGAWLPASGSGFTPREPLGVLVLSVERSPFGPYPEVRVGPAVFQSPRVGSFSSATSSPPSASPQTGVASGVTSGAAAGAARVDTTQPARPPVLPLRAKEVARATTDRPAATAGPGAASPGQTSTVVQEGAGTARPAPTPDVDALARQVYAAIKQRLAIEKERLGDSRTLRTW